MKDAQGDPAYGRTNWRRFALAVGFPAVIAGGLFAGVANGALPASFSVSGTSFKLSADKLVGDGFTQYSGTLETEKVQPTTGKNYVVAAKSGIHHATITNLCQTVAAGPVVLRIEAGKGADKVVAENLLIGMSELRSTGDTVFEKINIGQDGSTLDKDQLEGDHGDVGSFGQQADTVTINGLQQVAYSTTASTFTLPGMNLKLYVGESGKECF